MGGSIADRVNTSELEAASTSICPPLGETDERHRETAQPKPVKERAATFQRNKPETLSQQDGESPPAANVSNAKLSADDQTGPTKQFLQAPSDNIQFFPSTERLEDKAPDVDLAISAISNPELPENAKLVTTEAAMLDGDLGPEHTVPTTAAARREAQSPNGKLIQMSADARQAQSSEPMENPLDRDAEKARQRYRPPPQVPPRQPAARPVNAGIERDAPSDVSLGIRIRLTLDRFGFCQIGLLPACTPDLDSEVAVKVGGIPLLLIAQEDWYQDLPIENIGDHLQQGVELKGLLADRRRVKWLLTGRDLYVLASHQSASGFISTNRLMLGGSHIVLCRMELLPPVEAILSEAGCEGYTKLDESHGVPAGWAGLRGVAPTKAISLSTGIDPFYAIKPKPDIEIGLDGGVCLGGSVWLAGYPPEIKLFGELNGTVKVLIDGKEAQQTSEGFLTADGYEQPGQHSVYCEGLSCSRSYSIGEPPDSWQEWSAYHLGQADICGPLVHLAPETVVRQALTVPMSNRVLLGAEPGEIFHCSSRRVSHWRGFVPFDVVWALPAHPLISDKKTARIIQLSDLPFARRRIGSKTAKPMLDWSNVILDAARKGLRVESDLPDSMTRWNEYKRAARNIWRAAR